MVLSLSVDKTEFSCFPVTVDQCVCWYKLQLQPIFHSWWSWFLPNTYRSTIQTHFHGDYKMSLFMKLSHCSQHGFGSVHVQGFEFNLLHQEKENRPKWETWIWCGPEFEVFILLIFSFLIMFVFWKSTKGFTAALCTVAQFWCFLWAPLPPGHHCADHASVRRSRICLPHGSLPENAVQ